jgi:hypothetical protein
MPIQAWIIGRPESWNDKARTFLTEVAPVTREEKEIAQGLGRFGLFVHIAQQVLLTGQCECDSRATAERLATDLRKRARNGKTLREVSVEAGKDGKSARTVFAMKWDGEHLREALAPGKR